MVVLNTLPLSDHYSVIARSVVLLLIAYRSYRHKSLTNAGLIASLVTGFIHSLPRSNLPLILLLTFFITSSQATKYKEEIKAKKVKTPKFKEEALLQSQRSHVQVFANSLLSSILIIISVFTFDKDIQLLLKAGIIGQYVTVIADTWSSELGILSETNPFLITTLKTVPPGTNGGISRFGLLSGALGAALLSSIASLTYLDNKFSHFVYFTAIGISGTLIDSLLGALFQFTLVDKDGLVLEPSGGERIDTAYIWENRADLSKVTGEDILSNNQVNFVTSLLTTLISIGLYQFFL